MVQNLENIIISTLKEFNPEKIGIFGSFARNGKNYHFKIASFLLGDKLASEAIEVVEGKKGREPYIFIKLSKFDVDRKWELNHSL